VAGSGALLVLLYLLFWPLGVEPAAWNPPPDPGLRGAYAPNRALAAVRTLPTPDGVPSEDVAIGEDGGLYATLLDGRIVRWEARPAAGERPGRGPGVVARTGGRPLGIAIGSDGVLWVADSRRGLLAVDTAGTVRVAAARVGAHSLRRANGVTVAPDGTVYVTQSSVEHPPESGSRDVLIGRPNGRLLAHDPATGATRVVLDSLWFANGVAPGPEPGTVLVVETARYRVRRVWTEGRRAGEWDCFVQGLPGFPDGISWNGTGIWWLGLVARRSAVLDWLWPRPFLRSPLLRLPETLRPDTKPFGFVLGLDARGRVRHNFQDPTGRHFRAITNAVQAGDELWLGSLRMGAVGRFPLPESSGAVRRGARDPGRSRGSSSCSSPSSSRRRSSPRSAAGAGTRRGARERGRLSGPLATGRGSRDRPPGLRGDPSGVRGWSRSPVEAVGPEICPARAPSTIARARS